MDAYKLAHVLHLLAATVWVGGHIAAALGVVPRLLRGDRGALEAFERAYERVAAPSLAVAAATGAYMGLHWYPPALWFSAADRAWVLGAKAALVAATAALAASARLALRRARARGEEPSPAALAAHVTAVAAVAVALAVLGWGLGHA